MTKVTGITCLTQEGGGGTTTALIESGILPVELPTEESRSRLIITDNLKKCLVLNIRKTKLGAIYVQIPVQ